MNALFGKKPAPPEPVRMPVQDDAEARAAAERQKRAIGVRQGRTSTVMSRGTKGEAGTGAYGNSLLGQAN